MKDLYHILGLEMNCTAVEIGLAYRKLSDKFRPDVNQHDPYFENRYREINEAFDLLSDPMRRSKYDAELKRFKATAAVPVKKSLLARTKWVDVVFTLVLISITIIFGRYVLQSIGGSKAKEVAVAPVVAAIPAPTTKFHKKKHRFRTTYVAAHVHKASQKVIKVPATYATAPAPVSQPKPMQPVTSVISNKPVISKAVMQQSDDNESAGPGYLFSTYLKANETGVINLREYDGYNADVIRVLPNNTKVYVLEKTGRYYKVAYEGTVGYVPNWTVGER
jgi:hypothetical protein